MPTIRITPPAAEPISLTDARAQCRIAADDTAEDALLGVYIQAAREAAEQELCRSLIDTTWEDQHDGWPEGSAGPIELGHALAASITSVTYTTPAGASVVLDSSAYVLRLSDQRAWLMPATGTAWPDVLQGPAAQPTVRVRYVSGYGSTAAAVPAGIRQWLLLTVGTLYAQRESVDATGRVAALPARFVDRLLDAERIYG